MISSQKIHDGWPVPGAPAGIGPGLGARTCTYRATVPGGPVRPPLAALEERHRSRVAALLAGAGLRAAA